MKKMYLCTQMATLHIFNPEHDIALAANLANFTAPRAGRQLRHDLGFLPALWAKPDDYVLVDDVERAACSFRNVMESCWPGLCEPHWTDCRHLQGCRVERIEPWGWDAALVHQLRHWGVEGHLLPSGTYVDMIRRLSHRRTAMHLLASLQGDRRVGEAAECFTMDEVAACQNRWHDIVLKAPWSSSGRGVRFVSEPSDSVSKWITGVIGAQGSVMAEPRYENVYDLGMEFEATGDGRISYCGLSLFDTSKGAYTGNVLTNENKKKELIKRYISEDLLSKIKEDICHTLDVEEYVGPLGVDMMIVHKDGLYLLHPCVEINLRRTMGHVALSLPAPTDGESRAMRILYDGNNYQFNICKL